MRSRSFGWLLALVMALAHLGAHAEDIDLFQGTSSDQSKAPNLLLLLDNAAAFSANGGNLSSCPITTAGVTVNTTLSLTGTVGGVEQCALYNVVAALDLTNPVNLGVMVYNGSGVVDYTGSSICQAVSGAGGCLVLPLTLINTETARTNVLNWIKSWQTSNGGSNNWSKWIKASGQATGALMQESWAYLYGKVGLSGRNYSGIAPDTSCKNFVVFIGNAYGSNGTPGDSTGDAGPKNALEGSNSVALKNANPVATGPQKELLTLASGITSANTSCGVLNFPGTNNHENSGYYADEWARYMAANRITTYTVGFLDRSDCKPDYPWLLSSMASNSGGTYFATSNYQELIDALQAVFSEVRSVNSVFAAVSLPVSVNSQGTYLNQVFIGMFKPDANGRPRWFGNLKQYKMGFDSTGSFTMLDAQPADASGNYTKAISASGSEFIAECAVSFWTAQSTDSYWTGSTAQNCSSTPAISNYKDGNLVEKGGQGYMLRKIAPSARVVKTCSPVMASCQTTLTDFKDTNTALAASVAASIPTTSTLTAANLINWTRGNNNHESPEAANLNGSAITSANMRPSSHGDVVHSRPAAVNFATTTTDTSKVVVFYGGNDGMLRAINGNRSASLAVGSGSVAAGDEFWSFLPPEYYGKLYRRYQNTDTIDAGSPKTYAMDGPITAYRPTATSDAWVFVGMRRGGRSLYAFTVNASTLAIDLKWKRGCIEDILGVATCSDVTKGDFSGIGQTWSQPTVFTSNGYKNASNVTKPMLIFGGGYDATCEDALSYTCSTTKGNKLYVLDADSGEIQKTFTTKRSVIADVTIVPDTDGTAKFIYGVDLGGNIYRISGPLTAGTTGSYAPIGTTSPANWIMTTVASLGCDTTVTCTSPANRKFMYAPDIVVDGSDYILLLGSGDREKPTKVWSASTASTFTTNYFFAVKDRPDRGESYLKEPSSTCDTSYDGLCLKSLLAITLGTTPSSADLDAKKGWYLSLKEGGEQVVTGAIAVFGTVYFTTHTPKSAASNSCVPNLGTSRAYAVKYTNGASARTGADAYLERADSGLAPDLVVGKVTLDGKDGSESTGSTVPFCIGCDGPIKPSQPTAPGLVNNPAKIRSYWYIQK